MCMSPLITVEQAETDLLSKQPAQVQGIIDLIRELDQTHLDLFGTYFNTVDLPRHRPINLHNVATGRSNIDSNRSELAAYARCFNRRTVIPEVLIRVASLDDAQAEILTELLCKEDEDLDAAIVPEPSRGKTPCVHGEKPTFSQMLMNPLSSKVISPKPIATFPPLDDEQMAWLRGLLSFSNKQFEDDLLPETHRG